MKVMYDSNVLTPEVLDLNASSEIETTMMLIENSSYTDITDLTFIGSVDSLSRLYPPYGEAADKVNDTYSPFIRLYTNNDTTIWFIGDFNSTDAHITITAGANSDSVSSIDHVDLNKVKRELFMYKDQAVQRTKEVMKKYDHE